MKKQFSIALLLCAVTVLLSTLSCNNSSNKDNANSQPDLTGHNENGQHEHIYACPMHPDVTGKEGDKCPKCGMALQHADEKVSAGNYTMQFTATPPVIEAGNPALLSFVPKNKDNIAAAVPLDVVHEKKIHLIAVSEDLSWFNHIHPQYGENGAYTVSETFPNGGNYLLYADYKPSGSTNQIEKIAVTVQGNPKKPVKWSEPKLTSKTDGYEVKFVNGNELKAGTEGHLLFSIEQNGKPVEKTVLEKYLGANAHIVMIGQDNKAYLHVHPEADELPIHAHTLVPEPGIYRMWLQFQTKGKLHTADFVVNATTGSAPAAKEAKHDHDHGHDHDHDHDHDHQH